MPRTPIPPKVRWQILARDGFRCRYCGAKGGDVVLVVDHEYPVSRGGRNTPNNLITACEECNQGKSDLIGPTLLEIREMQSVALRCAQWLVDEWSEETGDSINWMPNNDIYRALICNSPDYETAKTMVRLYAERARENTVGPRALLTEMWASIEEME